ncbi:hypothetical protein VC566_00005, partial [Citrobacter freundii]|nr:hypothetical protein [Citrobacter freundii]
GTVCVVGKIRDLILQLSKSSIYSTKPPLLALFFSDECQEPDIRDDQIYSEEYFLFLRAIEYA